MFTETTFMRYGHDPVGIIGIMLILKPLKQWALNLHTFTSAVVWKLIWIRNSTKSEYSKHKEEGKTKIANNTKERQCLRAKLEHCVDPSNPDTSHGELVNIHCSHRVTQNQESQYSKCSINRSTSNE
jgi:hypothetical protein